MNSANCTQNLIAFKTLQVLASLVNGIFSGFVFPQTHLSLVTYAIVEKERSSLHHINPGPTVSHNYPVKNILSEFDSNTCSRSKKYTSSNGKRAQVLLYFLYCKEEFLHIDNLRWKRMQNGNNYWFKDNSWLINSKLFELENSIFIEQVRGRPQRKNAVFKVNLRTYVSVHNIHSISKSIGL